MEFRKLLIHMYGINGLTPDRIAADSRIQILHFFVSTFLPVTILAGKMLCKPDLADRKIFP